MGTTHVASTQELRTHFPALRRIHNDHPVAYFDGPGGTQVPQSVVDAVTDYLLHHNANTHWNYPTSQETDQVLNHARQVFADFFNAKNDEVAFGPNMTTLTFHVSRALGQDWGPGDEVVVTELDHHANVDPWKRLAKERGMSVRVVPFNPHTGLLDMGALAEALSANTKLLAIGAASNALGTMTDIAQAVGLAKEVGALTYIDAVHYCAHHVPDVNAWGCDFLVCSPYKFYGPHLGVLFGKRALLQSLDVPKLVPSSNDAPERLETGTQNHEGIAGAAAAIEFLAGLTIADTRREALLAAAASIHERNAQLFAQLWEALAKLKNVELFGLPPDGARTPTLGFAVGDIPSAEVCVHLARRGVFASDGDFYATTVIERLGKTKQGLVRAGCACYSNVDEIERLMEGVSELV